jgi:hypothetical protein
VRDGSSFFGAIGFGISPKHAAVAIIEDQNATHSKAGMIISTFMDWSIKPGDEITFMLQRGSLKHTGVRAT